MSTIIFNEKGITVIRYCGPEQKDPEISRTMYNFYYRCDNDNIVRQMTESEALEFADTLKKSAAAIEEYVRPTWITPNNAEHAGRGIPCRWPTLEDGIYRHGTFVAVDRPDNAMFPFICRCGKQLIAVADVQIQVDRNGKPMMDWH